MMRRRSRVMPGARSISVCSVTSGAVVLDTARGRSTGVDRGSEVRTGGALGRGGPAGGGTGAGVAGAAGCGLGGAAGEGDAADEGRFGVDADPAGRLGVGAVG